MTDKNLFDDLSDENNNLPFDTGTLRASIRIETSLPPPDEGTLKRMHQALQQALESMMTQPVHQRPSFDPQYLIVHIDDMAELARAFRKSGQFMRRVKGRQFFNVYDSGPADLYRLMSKHWTDLPRSSMVIYVDTDRRIERGKIIKLPKVSDMFPLPELKLKRETLPESLLWRSWRGYGSK